MNVFEKLVERLKKHFSGFGEIIFRRGRPLEADGYHSFSMVFGDDYLVSLVWNRVSGFMLSTGYDIPYGISYDEIFGSEDATFDRIVALVESRGATTFSEPVGLAELRKLLGVRQSELAARLEMTKGGLSQIENESDLLTMKMGTIKKLVSSLGANLVLTAHFPNGDQRTLLLD